MASWFVKKSQISANMLAKKKQNKTIDKNINRSDYRRTRFLQLSYTYEYKRADKSKILVFSGATIDRV